MRNTLGFEVAFQILEASQVAQVCRKESTCNTGDPGTQIQVIPWVEKIPWRREWQPAPVFLLGEFHGQRSLAGYSPWICKELLLIYTYIYIFSEMFINPFPRERGHFQFSIYCLSNSVTIELLASAPSHLCHHKKYTFDLSLGFWHRTLKSILSNSLLEASFALIFGLWPWFLTPELLTILGISWVMSVFWGDWGLEEPRQLQDSDWSPERPRHG